MMSRTFIQAYVCTLFALTSVTVVAPAVFTWSHHEATKLVVKFEPCNRVRVEDGKGRV